MTYRFALSRTGNEDLSRDICGEVFLILCKKQPKFDSAAALRVWLIKTARNVIANEFKKAKTLPLESVRDVAVSDTLAFELYDLVNTLPPKLRDVTLLYYVEDMDVGDVAKAVGISAGTVKSRLSRARSELSKIYKEEIL